MRVYVPALDEKTRELLNQRINKQFQHQDGDDLQSVVREILNDRDVFTFLALLLKDDCGIKLGEFTFWDDTNVRVDYGLAIDLKNLPRQTKLFTRELFGYFPGDQKAISYACFPPQYLDKTQGVDYRGLPTPEQFVSSVNDVLQNPEKHVMALK